MAEKDEITSIIGELKENFEKLIIANPYLLKLLGKSYNNSDHIKYIDLDAEYKRFRKYDLYKNLMFLFLGFLVTCTIVTVIYFTQKNKNQYESFLFSAIPYLNMALVVAMVLWTRYLKANVDNEFLFNKNFTYFIIILLVVLLPSVANQWIPEYAPLLFTVVGSIVVIVSFIYIYNPLSSKKLNDTIIQKADLIQKRLDSLNKSIVQESHKRVLDRIGTVQEKILEQEMDALSKIHSLTVLDSLRLELIQNSVNGINLVEDWKYLDLSQKMIEDIMSCNNKRITMLGDLSFLSTKEGVRQLVTAIVEKGKSFYIYFTGQVEDNDPQIISSQHCDDLVENIKNDYSEKTEILDKIRKNVHLYPIPIKYFTGISFIGLIANNTDNNIKRYEKVYAYISSHLIAEKGLDITRANPFVFSWGSDKTYYFEEFMKSGLTSEKSLKVRIKGKPKEESDIFNFD